MEIAAQVDARKTRLTAEEALALAAQAEAIFASKGKQVVHLDLTQDRPDPAALAGLLLGPTGNLRAPTLRVGKTLIVGFDQATYTRLLT